MNFDFTSSISVQIEHLHGTRFFKIEFYYVRTKKCPTPVKEWDNYKLDLAATYSHGSYTTTTIGNAAFYGRVRDGIG